MVSVPVVPREFLKRDGGSKAVQGIFGFYPANGPFTAGANFLPAFSVAANGNAGVIELQADAIYRIVFFLGTDVIDGAMTENIILKSGATTAEATIADFDPATDVVDNIWPTSIAQYRVIEYHAQTNNRFLGIATFTGSAEAVNVSVTRLY